MLFIILERILFIVHSIAENGIQFTLNRPNYLLLGKVLVEITPNRRNRFTLPNKFLIYPE